jgi:hypothetical protein
MRKSDIYRKTIINQILTEGQSSNNRVSFSYDKSVNSGVYSEIITIEEIQESTENFTNESSVENFLENFIHNRIGVILEDCGYSINMNLVDLGSSDFYDGYELNVPILKENEELLEDLFSEIDAELTPEPKSAEPEVSKPAPATPAPSKIINKHVKNRVSDVPITKEPTAGQTPHLPTQAKARKTQNPRKVDLLLKSTFESKFVDYKLSTDLGDWKPIKTLKADGKLMITWESVKEPSLLIETILFPADSNKVKIKVKNRKGQVFIDHFLEIYRIPTDAFLAERFFRKTYFNLLKKFIDTRVITLEPFATNFIFWKTDNPNFSYSFSSPNKNKILLDLISFISTARKPILDDFFEQNNLKHKQGYLQTLLDAAEAAGIFRFKREGNEIIILKGPNYKPFLDGKVRRVTT